MKSNGHLCIFNEKKLFHELTFVKEHVDEIIFHLNRDNENEEIRFDDDDEESRDEKI